MASLLGQDIPFLDAAYRPRAPMPDTGGESFFKGWQRAQEEKKLALEQQQQAVMLPLQQKQAQLQIQGAALDLTQKTRMADAAINIKAGQAALADKLASIDWSNTTDRASVWEIGKQYPDLLSTPIWEKVQENFINSDKASAQALHYRNLSEEANARALFLQAKLDMGTPAQQDLSAASRLRQEAESLRASGNAIGYQDKIRQAEILETHLAPKGITVQTGVDDQGRPITTTSIGGGGGAPTTSTQSRAQQQTINSEIAVEGINDIMSKVTASDVGVRGVVGEQVFDKWLSQVDPTLASQPRVESRTALRALRENLFAAMSAERTSGTGFSNKDAERIKELASGLEASTSYPDLVSRMGEIRRLLSERTKVYAQRTGQPVPDFAKSPAEIKSDYETARAAIQQDVRENRITNTQGQADMQRLYQRAVESLRRFHGINVQTAVP